MKKLMLLVTAAAALALLAPGAALAKSRDRNHDRIPDRWERHFHLSLDQNQARKDQDRDGLNNLAEFRDHTSPRDADTDNDGIDDGEEVATANDPTDRDTDNDGIEDENENSGTVASFNPGTGALVINLARGGTLTGQVDGTTGFECRTAAEQEAENESEAHAAEDGGGDNSGPGSTSSGDGEQQASTCGAADLTTGAVVHEAEVQAENGQAVFEKVELIK